MISLDPDDFERLHQQCVKLLEIAYILYNSDENFPVETDHPIHRPNNECLGYHLEDQQILTCPDLYLRALTGDEVNDVKIFFEELFDFKDLNGWYNVLDQLLVSSREEISAVKNDEIGYMVLEINEYLEKLISEKSSKSSLNAESSIIDAYYINRYTNKPVKVKLKIVENKYGMFVVACKKLADYSWADLSSEPIKTSKLLPSTPMSEYFEYKTFISRIQQIVYF